LSERYQVRVTKDFLVFSAAHFITFQGDTCERLHGHNYQVAAEVAGPLDENHYVVDFIALRDSLRELVADWDHYVLLPTSHPLIRVTETETEVEARFRERRWVFPRGDCKLLPIANTTAELLARLLGQRLHEQLVQKAGFRADWLRIEVDECNGQLGICELRPDDAQT